MINFFRKIRKTLAEDNKPLKYLRYAIGEIILVVIGILIALQINTWNKERINAREEQRIFRDLAEELEYNRFLVENGNSKMTEVLNAAKRLLAAINSDDYTYDEKSLNQDLDKITWVWVSGRPTTLYDVLSASGDFKLISSPELRKKLADLKRNQESLIKFEEIQSNYVDNQLRPFLNRSLDRTTIRTVLVDAKFITTTYPSVFEPNNLGLVHNREFANLLTDLIFFTMRIEKNYSRIEDDIFQIDSLLQAKYPDINPEDYIPY